MARITIDVAYDDTETVYDAVAELTRDLEVETSITERPNGWPEVTFTGTREVLGIICVRGHYEDVDGRTARRPRTIENGED